MSAMEKSDAITVQVFRDIETPNAAVEPLIEGVSMVREIVPSLNLLNTRYPRIKISAPGADFIDSSKIRWPEFKADINLIATSRPLFEASKSKFTYTDASLAKVGHSMEAARSSTLGISSKIERKLGGEAVAIVDTQKSSSPAFVTAHEIGHLFAVGTFNNPGSDGHCEKADCIMYPTTDNARTSTYNEDLSAILEKGLGLLRPFTRFKPETEPRAESFCDRCAHDLGYYAFYLSQAKNGNTFPEHVVWGAK